MKNEEISLYTKKAFSEALKKAMKKKPFQKITVSELIRECNVNRKTFYYHFEDIYDLLKWTFEQEAINVIRHFDLLVDYEEALNFIMDYVEDNDYIINCACDLIGQDELKRFFRADFLDIIVTLIDQMEEKAGIFLEKDYKSFLSYFYTEALAGMLLDGIREREHRSRHVMIQYISDTMLDSLSGIFRKKKEEQQGRGEADAEKGIENRSAAY